MQLGQRSSFHGAMAIILCQAVPIDYALSLHKSEAGWFVDSIEKHMDSLFTFLIEEGVEPTNDFAERIIRFAVL
jgi:hypothetical protein